MIPTKARILIVDDEPFFIDVLVDLLKAEYSLAVAKDGEQALRRAASAEPPDLVLLDVVMPGLNGYQVLGRLKENVRTAEIPVIFLTVLDSVEDETRGLELGAVDYIKKPLSPPLVRRRIRTHLALADQRIALEKEVQARTLDLVKAKDAAVYCMATLAETRDKETGAHIRRTQHYVKTLAEELQTHPRFGNHLDARIIDLLYRAAPLHDIGKVGVPDRILLKPGRLQPDEWRVMQTHTTIGHDAILKAAVEVGETSFIRLAAEIAHSHHEKWDGSGYPQGLAGERIPVSGRLMALADVYDALICKRVYKGAIPHETAREYILENSGRHFDPDVVDAFLNREEDFVAIARRFVD
jgi:putative two-component system response regulator